MLTFSDTAASAMLQALVTRASAGSGPALLKLYSGTAPPDEAYALPNVTVPLDPSNTLLAAIPLADPIGTVTAKRLVLTSVEATGIIAATGTATFFRLTDSDGIELIQGTVGVGWGANDLAVSSASLVAGGDIDTLYIVIALP